MTEILRFAQNDKTIEPVMLERSEASQQNRETVIPVVEVVPTYPQKNGEESQKPQITEILRFAQNDKTIEPVMLERSEASSSKTSFDFFIKVRSK